MPVSLPISVLLLARDEAARLGRLLPELAFAREVVVVWDPSGTTATREVAEASGARVFARVLEGFGSQRRFGLERCTQPWVLWLDADERLSREAVRSIRKCVASDSDRAGFWIARHGWFLGRRIRFCGWQGERVLRLFRRDRARFDDAPIHERAILDGPAGRLEGAIEHHSYASWAECVEKLVRYARAGADKARAAGRSATVLDVALRPPLRFLRMYALQLGILDGTHGLLLCALATAQVFLKYADLWSRGRGEGRGGAGA